LNTWLLLVAVEVQQASAVVVQAVVQEDTELLQALQLQQELHLP
jgi:hypothetical protein